MQYSKDTFCPYPFTYASTTNSGEYRVCCESMGIGLSAFEVAGTDAWNSSFYKDLRKDLIEGRKNKHCASCWKNEEVSNQSSRLKEMANYSNEDIAQMLSDTDSDGFHNKNPVIFEFKVGNVCNLKCIMCTQMESSSHESEIKMFQKNGEKIPVLLEFLEKNVKNSSQVYRYDNKEQDKLIQNLKSLADSLTDLMIVGGEPLRNKLTGKILESLIDVGYAKNINLIIISNVYNIDFEYLNVAKEFKGIYLNASVDHVNSDKFNFIRYPSNYKVIEQNIKKILNDYDVNLAISFTYNIFNALDLKEIFQELLDWQEKFRTTLNLEFNHVTYPKYFNVQYLSYANKIKAIETVKSILEDNNLKTFLERNNPLKQQLQTLIDFILYEPEDKEEVNQEQIRVLDLYDKYRKTDWKKSFPYLS